MLLLCTYELCNYISYQVQMVRARSTDSLEVSLPLRGMLACNSYNCFVMWRPRDTISAQTMARHQSRV